MAELTAAERDAIPDKDFALPGRRYPVHDREHAANALARVSENGSPKEKRLVRMMVKHRYPDMEVEGLGKE